MHRSFDIFNIISFRLIIVFLVETFEMRIKVIINDIVSAITNYWFITNQLSFSFPIV